MCVIFIHSRFLFITDNMGGWGEYSMVSSLLGGNGPHSLLKQYVNFDLPISKAIDSMGLHGKDEK